MGGGADIQIMSKTRRAPGDASAPPRHEDAADNSGDRRSRSAAHDTYLAGSGGLQGAARYGLLNIPEPVAAADSDFNRGISLAEFEQAAVARFALLDRAHSGRLTLAQLQAMRPAITVNRIRNGPRTRPTRASQSLAARQLARRFAGHRCADHVERLVVVKPGLVLVSRNPGQKLDVNEERRSIGDPECDHAAAWSWRFDPPGIDHSKIAGPTRSPDRTRNGGACRRA